MAQKSPKIPLTVVGSTSVPSRFEPPATLGQPGRELWRKVMEAYDVSDVGGAELLSQACSALDRAERLRAEIDQAGEILTIRGQLREHPGLKGELACRSFVCKQLRALGLDVEPTRPLGRQAGHVFPGGRRD